jgi:hypothetical protein
LRLIFSVDSEIRPYFGFSGNHPQNEVKSKLDLTALHNEGLLAGIGSGVGAAAMN